MVDRCKAKIDWIFGGINITPDARLAEVEPRAELRQSTRSLVEILSTTWIVNVVKLLCSVSRSDDATSLLLFEHLLNGNLYEWLDAHAVAKNV